MKVCVVGAGAIGGLLAVKMAASGVDVHVIARGTHLEAIKEHGLRLIEGETETCAKVSATKEMTNIGTFDVVFICVKGHRIAPIVDELNALCNEQTVLVSTQNGIPWWYFQEADHIPQVTEQLKNHSIEAVDPGSVISSTLDPKRIIGCVVYPAAHIKAPGIVQHVEGNRFPVGELNGSESERVKKLSEMLIRSGFKSPVLPDVRSELWLKCWGSCCFNPLSALTHSTLEQICTFPLTRKLAEEVMTEAQTIGEKLGATFRVPLERRINGAAAVGNHKTSMLQDAEEGRAMEIDALVGSVVELGRLTSVQTPHLNTIYWCVKLLANTLSSSSLQVKAQPIPS